MRDMQRRHLNNRSRQRALRGFSLIEVLVALVVLAIGVLAIARIFPGGFLSIQRTGEQTAGQSLAAQQLADIEQQGALPESVLAVLPDTASVLGVRVITDALPNDITDFYAGGLPAGVSPTADPYYFSNINRYRYIKGEAVRLPVMSPNTASGGVGAVYLLNFGPVFNTFGSGAGGARTDSLVVYGAPLERTEQDSVATISRPNPTPVLISDAQYAIDYDRRRIAFFPRVGAGQREFLLQFDYVANEGGTPRLRTQLNFSIRVPDSAAGAPPVWVPIFQGDGNPNADIAPANFVSLQRGTEEVSRRFRLLPSAGTGDSGLPAWTGDPYEYSWYSPQQASNANPGVLVFNPLGRSTTFGGVNGNRPFTARVDYTTLDNHIIREDRSVPSVAPYDIKLSLQNLLTEGDILPDQTSYRGMFRTAASTPSVMIFNKATGELVDAFTGTCTAGVGGGRNFTINSRTGTLRLNQDYVVANNLQTANLRIYYRAQKDWGMQIQKAHNRYLQAPDVASMNYRSFLIGAGTRVYFPRSEAGKSVSLGEYYVRTSGGNVKRFTSEIYQLASDVTQFDGVGLPYLDVLDQHPEAQSEGWVFTDTATGLAVNHVQGLSLKSRVMWADSSDIIDGPNGDKVVKTRWRKHDVDTLISQNANP